MRAHPLLIAVSLVTTLAACRPDAAPNARQQAASQSGSSTVSLLNVSYDPTRELYQRYNELFARHWQQTKGQKISFRQSHGGSGKQALAVKNGLKADVVTLALAGDIDILSQGPQAALKPNWQQALPHNSTPYTSTIVFLVRKGNPKQIRDWGDLVKGDIKVITPNPKTSGGARWNFLAAWAWAKHQSGGSEQSAQDFVRQLYQRVPVLDAGARGASISFTQRNLGDVLLAWENEAHLALKEAGDQFEIVTPSLSILCEPPVAVVDSVVDAQGSREVATEYLRHLYSPEAQRLIAQNFYRPSDPAVAAEFSRQFPALKLVTINDAFGGWQQAQQRFFADGGVFDQIYAPKQ